MNIIDRDVVLRIVKTYPDAHNHIYTGRIVDYDGTFVEVDGHVLNFARPSLEDPTGGLTISARATRWVPVDRIQYIRTLPETIDPFDTDALQLTEHGNLALPD